MPVGVPNVTTDKKILDAERNNVNPIREEISSHLSSIDVGRVSVTPFKVSTGVQPVLRSCVRVRPQLEPPGGTTEEQDMF